MDSPLESLIVFEQQIQFGQDKLDKLSKYCRECEVRFVCNSEYPKHRFIKTPDGEDGLIYLCVGYKIFFNHFDFPTGVWECPDIFPLPLDNDKNKIMWVLKADIPSGVQYGGSGGQYFLGEFDGQRFNPDSNFHDLQNLKEIHWLDYGKDFNASTSWSGMSQEDNRRIIIGWLSNWQYAEDVPTKPWKNILSIPREFSLKTVSGKIKLLQKPVSELKKLRDNHYELRDFQINGKMDIALGLNRKIIPSELKTVFQINDPTVEEFGLELFESNNTVATIGYNRLKKQLFITREEVDVSKLNSGFSGHHFEPMETENNKIIIQLFIDSCSLELFGNNGSAVLTDLIFPKTDNLELALYSKNGTIHINNFDFWQFRSL